MECNNAQQFVAVVIRNCIMAMELLYVQYIYRYVIGTVYNNVFVVSVSHGILTPLQVSLTHTDGSSVFETASSEGDRSIFAHRFTRGRRDRDKGIKVPKGKKKGDEGGK